MAVGPISRKMTPFCRLCESFKSNVLASTEEKRAFQRESNLDSKRTVVAIVPSSHSQRLLSIVIILAPNLTALSWMPVKLLTVLFA